MQSVIRPTKTNIASIIINTNPAINIGAGKCGGVESPIRHPPMTAKIANKVIIRTTTPILSQEFLICFS